MSYVSHDGLAYFKNKLTKWVDDNYLSKNYTGNSTIVGNVTFTNPITGDINGKVKKDWLGQEIDKTYIKNLRPESDGEVALIYGDNHEKVITIDTAVTQVRSSSNEMYPVLLCYDANAEVNQVSKSVRYGHDVTINPAYGYLYANSYIVKHPSYNRTIATSTRANWMIDFRDGAFNPMSQIYSYLDPESQGGEHRIELRLYGNPFTRSLDLPNYNYETDTVSLGVSSTRGDKLTFFGYAPSTPIYKEDGTTMRKSTTRGDQYGRDIITRDWLNLNGSITGLVHTTMDETIDGSKTFKKTVTINSGDNNNKAGLYVQGNSDVHGNEHVYGTETVDGKLTANDTAEIKGGSENTPSLTVTGSEVVTGSSNIKGSLDVDGNANVDGTSNLHGKVTAGNGLEVTGNAKATTLTVTSGATVGTTLSVGGKTTLSGGLAVSSGTTTDTLTATNGATISGGVTVATGNLTVTSGGITANNGTGTFKTLSVTSGATVGTTLIASNASIGNGGLTVSGTANLNGGTTTTTLTASSNVVVSGNLTTSGSVTTPTANIKNLKITSGGGIVDNNNNEYVTTVVNNSSTRNNIVSAILATNGGLEQDSNKRIRVKAGNGITIDSNGLNIDFAAFKENNETEFNRLMESFVEAQRIDSSGGKNQFYVDGTNGYDTNATHSLGSVANLTALRAVSTTNLNEGDYYTITSGNSIRVWHNGEWSYPTASTRGTPAAPFKTIQACVNYITKVYNFHSVNSYINCKNITATNNPGNLILPNFNRTTADITIRAAEWTSSTARNNPTTGITSNSIKINYTPTSSSNRYAIVVSGTGIWKLRNFDVTITDTGITTSGGHLAALGVGDSATGDLAYCKFTVNRDSNNPENYNNTTGEHVIFVYSYGHVDIGPCVTIVGGDFTSPVTKNEVSYDRKLNGFHVMGNGSLQIDDTRDQSNQENGVDKRLVFTGNFRILISCTSQISRNKAYMGTTNTNGVNKADYRFYIYSGGQVAMSDSGKIDADHNNAEATDTWLDKTTNVEPFHEHIADSLSYVQTATYSWYD